MSELMRSQLRLADELEGDGIALAADAITARRRRQPL